MKSRKVFQKLMFTCSAMVISFHLYVCGAAGHCGGKRALVSGLHDVYHHRRRLVFILILLVQVTAAFPSGVSSPVFRSRTAAGFVRVYV